MKKLLLMCCLATGISAVSFAQSGGGSNRRTPEQQANQLKTSLSLNDDQTAKIKAIYEAQTKSLDSLRTASKGDMSVMSENFMPIMQSTQAKLKAVLTADQAAAYQKQLDERRSRMQQGGGGGN